LPLKQATIIKSWIISYVIYTLPFLTILLISLYAASSSLRILMSPLTYICFSIVLLCFATLNAVTIPTQHAEKIGQKITTKRIFMLVFAASIFIGIFIFTQFFSTYGIIHWLVIIIQKKPLLIAVLSLTLTIICLRYRYFKMEKQITKTDYF